MKRLRGASRQARTWVVSLLFAVGATGVPAAGQGDPLMPARLAYNLEQFDQAIKLASEARATPAMAHSASLILSRALLERFRRSGDVADVASARQALLSVDAAALLASERPELHLGMAELLFVDDLYGAAAEMFEAALDRPGMVTARQRERVLEWWAASLDRHAQLAPDAERLSRYRHLLSRLEHEAARSPGSPAVAYWLAAAARGVDDLDRAWSLAIAGWIQAPMIAGVRSLTLRNDLDRLMTDAIIPERARRAAPHADPEALKVALAAEWAAIKAKWGSREVA